MATGPVPADLDLHRPYVDDVVLRCPRVRRRRCAACREVIDAWFDSGSMPFAQWHYPFENEEVFDERFPADFICEAIDQTRGWFYSLLADRPRWSKGQSSLQAACSAWATSSTPRARR